MWDKEGSGFFGVKGLCDGTKYIHLCYWVIIAEDIFFTVLIYIVFNVFKVSAIILRINICKSCGFGKFS